MNQDHTNKQWAQYIEIKRQTSSLERIDSILEKRLKVFLGARQQKSFRRGRRA